MQNITITHLRKLVLRAIDLYNRYRSPEATAKLLKLDKIGFILDFEGSFCQSCGMQDYLEDFIYEFETLDTNVNVEIEEIEPTSSQSYKVKYAFKYTK